MELDHLAICAATLDEGVAAIETALGVPLAGGGKHALMGTHNRLLSLGPGEYLEVIAIDPGAPPPGRPRWFDLDHFDGPPRLTNWVCRTADLDAALAGSPPGAGHAHDLERGAYRWRMGIPDDGCLPFGGCFPALIQWQGDHPAATLPDQGCRLRGLVLRHPEADLLRECLAGHLADPRIAVEEGPVPSLGARIETPSGLCVLG